MVESRRGFTLVELVVAVAIVAVLVGLLLPAIQSVRAAAYRARCAGNLRQVGLALHGYHDANRELPPGLDRRSGRYKFLAWTARLLPHLEQSELWRRAEADFARQPRFWAPVEHPGASVVVPTFVCPADGRASGHVEPENFDPAFTHYLGNMGRDGFSKDGLFYPDSRIRFADVADGTSSTIAAGERPPSPDHRFGWWYAGVGQAMDGWADSILAASNFRLTFRAPTCPRGRPYEFAPGDAENMCDTFHYWSRHPGGAHFLMADGAVRLLEYKAAPLLPALSSRAGGEAVANPD